MAEPEGCVVLFWSTSTHLQENLNLFKCWNVRYINTFLVWRKINGNGSTQMGMGYYSRNSCEFMILGAIGNISQLRRK